MRLLLDHCAPRPLQSMFGEHSVVRAGEMGWERLANGQLIDAAEASGFRAIITIDKGMANQLNISKKTISIVILGSNDTTLDGLIPLLPADLRTLEDLPPGKIISITETNAG